MRCLALRALEWIGTDTCRAVFADDAGGTIETTFSVHRTPIGIVASSSPDILMNFDGTAAEARSIVAAVVQFCLVAQHEVAEQRSVGEDE